MSALIRDDAWQRWLMQTARTWDDLRSIVRETGIQSVDRDHRKMIEYALEVNSLVQQLDLASFGLDFIDQLGDLVHRLREYAAGHFSREEELIASHRLPGLEEHRKRHRQILDSVDEMRAEMAQGRLSITHNLKLALLEWVVVHINDMDYNNFRLDRWTEPLLSASSIEAVQPAIREIGIASLDDDHRRFISLGLDLNRVAGLAPAERAAQVPAVLDRLLEYAAGHFARETAFIARYRIEGLEAQEKQHAAILERLRQVRVEAGSRGADAAWLADVRLRIMQWWIVHVNTVDHGMLDIEGWSVRLFCSAGGPRDLAELLPAGAPAEDRAMCAAAMGVLRLLPRLAVRRYDQELLREEKAHLDALVRELKASFAREERGGALGEAHAKEHREFLAFLRYVQVNVESGKVAAADEFRARVLGWVVNHVNGPGGSGP